MGAIETLRDALFGNPPSPTAEPSREGVLAAFTEMYEAISGIVIGSGVGVVYPTRADLYADLAHDAGTVGFVYDDSTEAYNDFYVKSGASGAGAWTPTNALHGIVGAIVEGNGGRYVYANRTGGATPDEMIVTTSGGVPVSAYNVLDLYVFNVTGPNTVTGPTLSINGLTAKPIRKADGTLLAIGEYVAGTHLAVRYQADTDDFRTIFMSPLPTVTTGAVATFTQSNTSQSAFVGSISPDPISDPFAMLFVHRITIAHSEGGVSYHIPEFLDEPRQLRTVVGDQVSPGTWQVGDTVLFRYIAAGNYELIGVFPAAQTADDAVASSQQFYARANSSIYALRAFGK